MAKKNYEDFPLSLALFDAVPVIFFSAATVLIALRFKSVLFAGGAVLCALSGLSKVVWKIIIAKTKRDIAPLNRQMRFVMPVGFLLIIIGLAKNLNAAKLAQVKAAVFSFPASAFFVGAVLGMVLMTVFAFTLDSAKTRSNWVEQITNAIAQGCFLLGVISAIA